MGAVFFVGVKSRVAVKGWAYIPLIRRDGSVADYATVDIEDAAEIKKHKWHLSWHGDPRYRYAVRRIREHRKTQRAITMHAALMNNLWQGIGPDRVVVDHINHNCLDNRRCNLRLIKSRHNLQNRMSVKGSTSKYRGVHWHKSSSRWRAQVAMDGQTYRLGSFHDEEEAARVASEWRKAHMPYSLEMDAAS